jgi:hypothetical protein
MRSITELKDRVKKMTKECGMERRSMEIWLSALSPVNFVLVGMAGVLSLIAGASILTESRIISETTAGILALVSAASTVLHNRLRCEPHQAEIRRLKSAYSGLETAYDSLSIQDDPEVLGAKIAELDLELRHLRKTATESPMRWSVNKAKREVFSADA